MADITRNTTTSPNASTLAEPIDMPIKLEIEGTFKITNRGQFVSVRRIDPKANFYVTEKSFLGDIELAKFLDIPRALDEQGNQRQDIVVLQLKNPDDANRLIPKSIVEIIPGDQIHFLEPWRKLPAIDLYLSKELQNEMNEKHILYGKKVNAIARRQDNDDVLFELTDTLNKFAVVHLTYSRTVEKDPRYPQTSLFKNWLDLYNNCIVPDHILFNS